jgi:16S rRNA processing protein RimM
MTGSFDSSENSENPLVTIGRVRRPTGIKGAVLIEVYSGNTDRFTVGGSVIANGKEYEITGTGKSGDSAKLTFASIDSIEKAGQLRGVELFVFADSLPDNPVGVYYHYEILGVSVVTTDGRELGTLNEILETGGNDVFIVAPERIEGEKKPEEILIPVLDGVIASVDKETAIMTIDLPEGIL